MQFGDKMMCPAQARDKRIVAFWLAIWMPYGDYALTAD